MADNLQVIELADKDCSVHAARSIEPALAAAAGHYKFNVALPAAAGCTLHVPEPKVSQPHAC